MRPRGVNVGSLINVADPLAVFPSYGTITRSSMYWDFPFNATPEGPFSVATSGAGASVNPVTAPLNRFGVISLDTGTTAAGYASLWMGQEGFALGSGQFCNRTDINVPTASDGVDTYIVRCGLGDNGFTAAAPTDGVLFRYTHTENSGNWTCVCRSNGVETTANSGVAAVGATYQSLEIQVNTAGTSAVFYINGVSVGTIATNIPTGASRTTGLTIHIVKSAGTTNRQIKIDNSAYLYDRSTPI